MMKAIPKYPTDLYCTIYIDTIQKDVVICLIIPTFFFMLDPGWTTYVIHPGIFLCLIRPASKENVVGMIRQMTTSF